MKVEEEIKNNLATFASKFGPASIVPATVTEVNDDDTIKIQLSSGAVIDDARLRSVVKEGNKVVLIPKVDSVVLVGRIENSDEWVVLAVEEIDKVLYVIGDVVFEVNDDGFLMKKQDETMLQLMEDFIDAILQQRHLTKSGPTISLVPASVQAMTELKTRMQNFFRND